MPLLRSASTVLAAGLVLAGCTAEDTTEPGPNTHNDDPPATSQSDTLAPPESADAAFTYDLANAPTDAELEVEIDQSDKATMVELTAHGLIPNRGYAAHAHTNPCGPNGEAAGPHYQNRPDPAATPDKPSVDPTYANPNNEIWLDLRTDAAGSATSRTKVPFHVTDRAPASIVLHRNPSTATEPGHAGMAGSRLACLTIHPR